MAVKVIIKYQTIQFTSKNSNDIINILIIGVVVLVVAIPEGLPLAVTITLAFSIKKMLRDNNFVRRMEACETMGGANYICTDKTGTLTKNEMNIIKFYDGVNEINLEQTLYETHLKDYRIYFKNENIWNLMKLSFSCNSATEFDLTGNETATFKTDLTFTKFLKKFGEKITVLRDKYIKILDNAIPRIAFSSKRKKMSTILTSSEFPTRLRIFSKGASEIVLAACKYYLNENNIKIILGIEKRESLNKTIKMYASESLRTICICYRDVTEAEAKSWNEKVVVTDKAGNKKEVHPIEEDNLILIGILGIRDILKDGVEDAVMKCKGAGITVIMVTGDNIDTATAIARDCNIGKDIKESILGEIFFDKIGGIVCENCFPLAEYQKRYNELKKRAKEERNYKKLIEDLGYKCECFRTKEEAILKEKSKLKEQMFKLNNNNFQKSDQRDKDRLDKELEEKAKEEFHKSKAKIKKDIIANILKFEKLMNKIRVIARSQPSHKYALVTGLKQLNNVVAVTGDGTNDAPALSKADVGFAMGAGTDIAKEAADIIIVDDNFSSIINAIKWGRNVYDNIRRFLQFQLSVNICACVLVFVGVCAGSESPLSAVQMLWVNMIMDSLGSLALATEEPNDDLLIRMPYKRNEFIVNKKMFKHILGQSIYQLCILFLLLFVGTSKIKEVNPEMIDYGYKFVKCFNMSKISNSTIIYYDETDDVNKTAYLISGFETIFSNEDNTTYIPSPECSTTFPDIYNIQDAYKLFISNMYATSHYTIVFNTFVICQLFNEINCRILDDSFNIFKRITTNYLFIIVWFVEMILQIIIVEFTGPVFKVSKGVNYAYLGSIW
jgi:Ca2+ transporting ATPase